MIPIEFEKALENRLARIRKMVGYTDPFRKYTLTQEWADKKEKQLKDTGIQKMKEMIAKAEELGFEIKNAYVKDYGSIALDARREGHKLGGYVLPDGKLLLGMWRTRTPVLKINYRKRLNFKDLFLEGMLVDSGFREPSKRRK